MKKKIYKLLSIFVSVLLIVAAIPLSTMAAPAADIPSEMLDNAFLRALAYTGYDVQAQKDNGTIYKQVTGSVPASIRSNIGYGTTLSGIETVSQSGTATGLAPNISAFENSGLCCASYVSYVYYNYLPNIEGINTSNAPRPTNLRSATSYNDMANSWVSSGYARRIPFTRSASGDTFTALENIPIGSLIVFKSVSTGAINHVALYAGAYDGKHFVTHVGNSRGPEFCTITGMSKGDSPQVATQIVTPNFVNPMGSIIVTKKDTDGNPLAGAYFVATSVSTGKEYLIGPSNAQGIATSNEGIPYGQYTVKETVFPANYRAYGKTEWTITVSVANNGVVRFSAVNELIPGNLKIVKTSEDGKISGVEFTVSGNGIEQAVKTDENGTITIEDLKPGTYTVTEKESDIYNPQMAQNITVVTGQTATVNFSNTLRRGSLVITKTSEDNLNQGIGFHLFGTSLSGEKVDMWTETDEDGKAYFENIPIGSYTVSEDTSVRYITVQDVEVKIETDKTSEVRFHNILKKWKLQVQKMDSELKDENGEAQGLGTLKGAEYGIYKNDELVKSYTTDEFGRFETDSFPCSELSDIWYMKEISPSAGYVLDETIYPIDSNAENYYDEINLLKHTCFEDVIKGGVRLTKLNSKDTTKVLSGAEFDIYLDADNNGIYEPNIDTLYGKLNETETGVYELNNLVFNSYFLHESKAPSGFIKDDRYYHFNVSENGKFINIENQKDVGFINEPIPETVGEIPESPKTGDSTPVAFVIIVAMTAAGMMVLSLTTLKKKKHN